jgi:hypothetical protein
VQVAREEKKTHGSKGILFTSAAMILAAALRQHFNY